MDTFMDIFPLIVEFLIPGSDIAVLKFTWLPTNSGRRIVCGILKNLIVLVLNSLKILHEDGNFLFF